MLNTSQSVFTYTWDDREVLMTVSHDRESGRRILFPTEYFFPKEFFFPIVIFPRKKFSREKNYQHLKKIFFFGNQLRIVVSVLIGVLLEKIYLSKNFLYSMDNKTKYPEQISPIMY